MRKHDTKNGVQLYKCSQCKRLFRARREDFAETPREEYLAGKRTLSVLAIWCGTNDSTVKRWLAPIAEE